MRKMDYTQAVAIVQIGEAKSLVHCTGCVSEGHCHIALIVFIFKFVTLTEPMLKKHNERRDKPKKKFIQTIIHFLPKCHQS